jgi:uncharacterized damage-inducible protein DinB
MKSPACCTTVVAMNLGTTLQTLFAYNDQMNHKLLDAARSLNDAQLDQPFDMGMGTLRKTLAHIYVGEMVWLERWRGNGECKWPGYETSDTPATLGPKFTETARARDAFLSTLTPVQIEARQAYRDSKGNRFTATLHEMLIQGIVHSAHHRAQAVNMIRRVGGPTVEVDFMYSRRVPE